FEVVHSDEEIAQLVITYRRKKKIKLPDAIVLATAHKMGADLFTANTKDFWGIDNNVKILSQKL
ncbi:MAG: PIN domain-containing protein, partial [Bacteroidetes bacterium]|nr:PIN domain-containing protein [Bacteroidota bacterium]